VARRRTVLAVANICDTRLDELERVVFEVKKLPSSKKDSKTVKSEAQNRCRQKTFRRHYCEFSTGGELVTADAYQALLRWSMLFS
jgi:hypothetical protein